MICDRSETLHSRSQAHTRLVFEVPKSTMAQVMYAQSDPFSGRSFGGPMQALGECSIGPSVLK